VAPAELAKKTNLVEQKSTVSKFEIEFVDFEDPDNEDDDGQKSEKTPSANHVQKELKLEDEASGKNDHEKEMIRARNSVKKIENNLSGANSSIQRRETHISDLKKLVLT